MLSTPGQKGERRTKGHEASSFSGLTFCRGGDLFRIVPSRLVGTSRPLPSSSPVYSFLFLSRSRFGLFSSTLTAHRPSYGRASPSATNVPHPHCALPKVSPARPSTSSGLSALLAPGLPPSQANYAIDILLSPGSLSFRCGNHPAPELECGYNRNTTRGGRSDDVVRTFALEHEGGVKQSRDRDQAGSMAVRAAAEPEVAAAAATAATVKVAGGGEASVPGSVSGRDSSNAWGSMVFMTGDVDAEHGTAEDGGTWQRDHHLRRRQQEQESETWEGNKDLRVWVFHNFLAERGLSRQSLPGVSVWLANSTLSLMSATLTNEEIEVFLERDDANDNDNVRGVEALSGDQRGMETAVEFQSRTVRTVAKVGRHYDYGGEPTPWSKDDVDIENEVDRRKLITVGDNTDDDGEDEGGVFLFHRAFDGITGAPVPNAEANSSSLAAATSVMLLLGSGPEGGNEFPPITHATL